jgi:opacity protein-like surface antigen
MRFYSQGSVTLHFKEASMKKLLLAVSAMTLMMSGIVFAQAEMPVIDQRQANQDQRIDQGIASGQLNEREAKRLSRQREHLNKMEDRAMFDGELTKRERARIGAAQNRASHHIAREKHDRQGKRHR